MSPCLFVFREGKVGGAVREGFDRAEEYQQMKASGTKYIGSQHLNSRSVAGDTQSVYHIAKERNTRGHGNFLNHSYVTGECGLLGE